jgi:hypothetical protein
MKYELIKGFSNERFRQVTGVKIATFEKMVGIVKAAEKPKDKAGRKRALSVEDAVLIMLEYYKEYRTFDCIAASYGISKSTVYETICRVENLLLKSGIFSLPGKKTLKDPNSEYDVVVVDTTEIPIERPKKNQKEYYSGKKNDIR